MNKSDSRNATKLPRGGSAEFTLHRAADSGKRLAVPCTLSCARLESTILFQVHFPPTLLFGHQNMKPASIAPRGWFMFNPAGPKAKPVPEVVLPEDVGLFVA